MLAEGGGGGGLEKSVGEDESICCIIHTPYSHTPHPHRTA